MYHITAAKIIKPCGCSSCRAKHGQFATLEEAEARLAELTGQKSLDLEVSNEHEPDPAVDSDSVNDGDEHEVDELGFKRIRVPRNELAQDPTMAESELAEEIEQGAANEFFEEQIEEIVEDEEVKLRVHSMLDDDVEFLKGDDSVLSAAKESALLQQMDNVVSWRLENFYDDNGKVRGKYSLRSNPPIFRIESSDGAQAEFVLSKNLTLSLFEAFDTVKRGYYGVSPKKKGMITQEEAMTKPQEWKAWALSHPLKAFGLVVLFILCVVTAFTL